MNYRNSFLLLLVLQLAIFCSAQQAVTNAHLMIAPGSITANTATVLWDKVYTKDSTVYEIWLNKNLLASTATTNFTISGLAPQKNYAVSLRLKGTTQKIGQVNFTTAKQGRVFNIVDYGAKADSNFKNTKAIQQAIDACTPGGIVYIPKGIFISGAIFLKSNMTLLLDKDAILKGSADVADYEPMYLNRFEGWELKTYASLINAGTLNHNGSYNATNIRITGEGTISGGGKKLGDAMIKAGGLRSRGRLICLMNCQDVSISGLTIEQPPSWTIHYIYSNRITCSNLFINTYGIRNGDGIDPDSSTDCYIFNCTFDTGDDCIAIKSGKNPEGYFIGKPTKNVRITHCNFKRGHGISIGSEMSGGVSDVLVQDCKAAKLLHGMQIKGTKDRGGYVKNVTVSDCQLLQVTIFSAVNYNNDGAPAPELPTFSNFTFRNLDLSQATGEEPVIDINGFADKDHKLKQVVFNNIVLPNNAKVVVKDAEHIQFTHVKTVAGTAPKYELTAATDVSY